MLWAHICAAAIKRAHHQWQRSRAIRRARQIEAVLCSIVDQLVDGKGHEIEEHDLDHRPQTQHGGADTAPGNGSL